MHFIIVGLLVLSSVSAWSASFDCGKASSNVERQICSTPVLSSLDEELAELFSTQIQQAAAASPLREAQRAWIRSRNSCRNVACLRQSYERRIAELACMDGPALASAIGTSTCAKAKLRFLDSTLDAQLKSRSEGLVEWRASRAKSCREEGETAGGSPGWQAASALLCEVAITERRLATLRGQK